MATKPRQSYHEKMLARAAYYDQQAELAAQPYREKAQAIRFAITELDNGLVADKRTKVAKELQQAIVKRAEERPAKKQSRPGPDTKTGKRLQKRLAILKRVVRPGEAYSTQDLAKILKASIYAARNSAQALGMTMLGKTAGARWTLHASNNGAPVQGDILHD